MAQTQHAAGPYIATANGGDDPEERKLILCAKNKFGDWEMIGRVDSTIGDGYGVDGDPEATAHLFAAAPELLAACQAVLDEFPAFDSKRIESVKAICRAAIAKAEER